MFLIFLSLRLSRRMSFGPGNDEGLITGPMVSASSLARGSWRKRFLVRAFMEIRYTESAEYIVGRLAFVIKAAEVLEHACYNFY